VKAVVEVGGAEATAVAGVDEAATVAEAAVADAAAGAVVVTDAIETARFGSLLS
jgi:hypothetical protein